MAEPTPAEEPPPPETDGPPLKGADAEEAFDFESHRLRAIEDYQPLEPVYGDLARAIYSILRTCLDRANISVHSVDHRAKSVESFGDKVTRAAEDNPNRPKYEEPLDQITDLAGVRVIAPFQGLVAEIQVRTILQHAWAEIEHDIQYKAVSTLPAEIRRRFMTLAGMLEIADREFQGLHDEDVRIREAARASVAAGRLADVEITPDALKSYLDGKLGPDGRMSEFSYDFESRVLRNLGFTNLRQLDSVLSRYDDDAVSRAVHGSRQGQLTRLEDVLLAAMGEEFIKRHPFMRADDDWFLRAGERRLQRMRESGIELGEFRPEEASPRLLSGLSRQALKRSLDVLPMRERQVLTWRFGLEGEPPKTLEGIGRRLGLSRERVRQIENQAIRRLAALRELDHLSEPGGESG